MSEKPPRYKFWWPSTDEGNSKMLCALFLIGLLLLMKGCYDEDLLTHGGSEAFFNVLVLYVGFGVGGWFFIINIGRFVHHFFRESGTIDQMRESQREKAELRSLRRRSEIKKLKEELGDDDEGEDDDDT